jgi:hypothetical protein
MNPLYHLPDVICILDTAWGYIRHGRLHRFTWASVKGAKIERVLRDYGIPCYGRSWNPRTKERTCLVPMKQAVWAEHLLMRSNVPLTCKLLRRNHTPGPMPKPWGVGVRRPNLVARIVRMMGV